MKNVTIRAEKDLVEEWDAEADEQGENRSDYLRNMIALGRQYEDLEADYEREIEELEARMDDLRRQLREANKRNDEVGEIVEYVEDQRSMERQYREAGLLTRAKWKLTGMPSEKS